MVLKDETALLVGNDQLALNISDGARVTYELPAPLGRYAFIQDGSVAAFTISSRVSIEATFHSCALLGLSVTLLMR